MKILCTILCVCLCLCACGALHALPDHRERGFRATVRWVSEGVTVCAELEAALGASGKAVLSRVCLTEPPTLAGAILTADGDRITMTLEGVTAPSAGAASIWQRCALLCAEGVMHEVCDTTWEGLAVRYSEIGEGEGQCGLFRDPKSGAPLRVEQGEHVLTVLRFLHT